MFFIILFENNQLLCGFLVKSNTMRADDYERKINYDWPCGFLVRTNTIQADDDKQRLTMIGLIVNLINLKLK